MKRIALGAVLLLSACTAPIIETKKIPMNTTFQWVLSEPLTETDAKTVDIDGFDNSADEVKRLKDQGKIVIGYISVGSWESWRPDANKFPKSIIGKAYPNWEGEYFLNIKRLDLLGPIIEARLDMLKSKGFDGVEPDNIDLYNYDTGFNITKEDVKRYMDWLITKAHERGLLILQKNAPELSSYLSNKTDGILLESGFLTQEYKLAKVYLEKNKAIIDVEYLEEMPQEYFLNNVCPIAKQQNITTILKKYELDNWIVECK